MSDDNRARQFIHGVAQNLIQWMPMGGSGAAFLSFAIEQDWVMALLMFPVMAVSVVWANYTKSFLGRLSEISSDRGREDVNALVAFKERLDRAIAWQLAGTDDQYLRCQGNACLRDTAEGVTSTFKPLLKDIFVPLELSGDFFRGGLPMPPGFKWDKKIIERLARKEGLQIWDVLERAKNNTSYRCLAIQAWGGYGKTTLLRHITYLYAYKLQRRTVPKLLPVLLYLRKWQEEIATGNELDLPALIERYHIPILPEGEWLRLPPNWAKQHLKQGDMLVMFDGFDEVKEDCRNAVSQWISRTMLRYPRSFFIITSRPAGYRSYRAENKPNSLFLKPFNAYQRERFINCWYLCKERHISADPNHPTVTYAAAAKANNLLQQLAARSELEDLARNPLLLNLIVQLHSYAPSDPSDFSRPIQLPDRRVELYRAIFRLQLGDRPLVKQIPMPLSARECQQILQKLALYMVRKNKPQIEKKLLLEQLKIYLEPFDSALAPSKFLQQIEQVSELLVKRDVRYDFAHLSFQACLAAMEIQETKQEALLSQNWRESWWHETILLYAAQFNANSFLQKLLNIGTQDAIALAYKCLQETPRKIDPQLAAELESLKINVKNSLYQPLEEYLKNGEWEKSDLETDHVMLQIAGKGERGWLDEEDIKSFPCEDLRIINQLWLDHSNNYFGFSVQKNIWLSVGGQLGEYDYEVYKKFGKQVQWYKNGEWIGRTNLQFSGAEFPRGHLPWWGGWVGGVGGVLLTSLFSRRDL
ncbi:MAG: GUN4 domain-containing protein [Cyanobacteria bacterium SBLK]|nr:GUN4 domain-containing protein [Cyanobacteria bacterium SBLK]